MGFGPNVQSMIPESFLCRRSNFIRRKCQRETQWLLPLFSVRQLFYASEQIRIFLGVIQLTCFRRCRQAVPHSLKVPRAEYFCPDVHVSGNIRKQLDQNPGSAYSSQIMASPPTPPTPSFIQSHDSYRGQHCET